MKEAAISLEHAGAGLTEWIRRARREHTTFVVLEAAIPIARLIPADSLRCTGADLAHALATTTLTSAEARAWAKDLRDSRAALSPPEDRWQ